MQPVFRPGSGPRRNEDFHPRIVTMATPDNWRREHGFDFAHFPAKTPKPQGLVICLHGIGDNAENFDGPARLIQERMPGAAVIALQAPLPYKHPKVPEHRKGYAWFPYGRGLRKKAELWFSQMFNRVPVVRQVEAFARAQLEKHGLDDTRLAYVGESMGAVVALQAGLSGRGPVPAAIVSRGGTAPPFTRIGNTSTQVLLQMGECDKIFNRPVPERPRRLRAVFNRVASRLSLQHIHARKRLTRQGVPVADMLYAAQGHLLNDTAWKDSAGFIARRLPHAAARPEPEPSPAQQVQALQA